MKKKLKLLLRVMLVAVLIAVGFLIGDSFARDSHRSLHDLKTAENFNEGWTLVYDGDKEDITLPYLAPTGFKGEYVIENTIPAEYAGMTLFFFSMNKNVRVELDGVEIYNLVNSIEQDKQSPGSLYNMVNLPENMEEGRIRIYSDVKYSEWVECFPEIKVINRDDVVVFLFDNCFWYIVASLIMMFMAVVMGILSFLSYFVNKSKKVESSVRGVLYLAAYTLCASLYYLIVSRYLSSYSGYTSAFDYAEYVTLMMLPIFLSVYYEKNILSDYYKHLKIFRILLELNVMLQIIIKVLGIADFCQMAGITLVLMGISIVIVTGNLIRLVKRERTIYTVMHLVLVIIFDLGYVLDCIRNIITPTVKYGQVGFACRISCLIYVTGLTLLHIIYLYKNYELRMNVQSILLEQQVQEVKFKNEEMEKTKEAAEIAKQEAIAANEAKSNFLAHISHEIRTPINAVLGMDEMILTDTKDKLIKSYAMDIKNAGKNLLSLINDILDFSKIESGKMELNNIDYDLFAVINDIDTMIKFRAEAKNLKFEVEVEPELPSLLHGDDMRIKQIITNLLTNAVKYTRKGYVKLSIKGSYQDEEYIMLHVKVIDTGVGIKPEDIDKLYEKFQRIDEQHNRTIEGTGLGMNITVQLLGMMGSELKVESVYGEGTTFSFDLIQQIIDDEPIGDYRKLAQKVDGEYKSGLYAPKAKVLIIDDNVMNCKVFSNLLKKTGIEVTEGNSGKECLRLVEENHYDIIFLDHMMPEMDGIETFHAMKKLEKNMCKDSPKIIFTANAIIGAKEMYLKEGFDDFISKPIIPEQLEEIIRTYLPKGMIEDDGNPSAPSDNKSSSQVSLDDLPLIEGIDWKIAMLHFTDTELLMDTVDNYYHTISSSLDEIEEFYSDIKNNIDNYRIKVHALKSTSALIGAMTVSSLAKLLEFAAKDKRFDTISSLHSTLIEEGRKLWNQLDEHLSTDKEKAADSYIADLFEILASKTSQFDIDGMDEVMAQLDRFVIKKEAAKDYEKLAAAVVNVDVDTAKECIENILAIYR